MSGAAPVSRIRMAWNATLVTHASGYEQDALGAFYGLPRPHFISRAAWRRALLAAALGYRGTPNCTQFFLEGALADYAVNLSVVLDPSRPTQLFSPGAEFTQDLVGRFVRIPDWGLFRVEGPYDVSDSFNEILTLSPYETARWQKPDWSVLPSPITVAAEFLAFDIVENQIGPSSQTVGDTTGTTTVYVFGDALEGVPPTFMQDPEEVAVASVDAGANTITTSSPHGRSDDDQINVYPRVGVSVTHVEGFLANTLTLAATRPFAQDELVHIYPGAGGVVPGGTSAVTDYYAQIAGDSLITLALTPGGSAVAFSDEGTLPLYVAPADAGNPAGVEPGGLSATTTYYAIVVSPTVLSVSLTQGGGAVNITSAGTLPLYVGTARPAGQPYGGIIMEDAYAPGNPDDPTAGPFPLFVGSNETLGDLAKVCENILPAGFKLRFVYVPPYSS